MPVRHFVILCSRQEFPFNRQLSLVLQLIDVNGVRSEIIAEHAALHRHLFPLPLGSDHAKGITVNGLRMSVAVIWGLTVDFCP